MTNRGENEPPLNLATMGPTCLHDWIIPQSQLQSNLARQLLGLVDVPICTLS